MGAATKRPERFLDLHHRKRILRAVIQKLLSIVIRLTSRVDPMHARGKDPRRFTALGHTTTQGRIPRDFAIDSTGEFLIVGNQDSDTVVSFRIDRETGDLQPTGHVASVPNPVCILPVQF